MDLALALSLALRGLALALALKGMALALLTALIIIF